MARITKRKPPGRKPPTLLQKADEALKGLMVGPDCYEEALNRTSVNEFLPMRGILATMNEHNTETLIDRCRAQLDANAWLPRDYQKMLFDALVDSRDEHTQTREELGKEVVRVRRLFFDMSLRASMAEAEVVRLMALLNKANVRGWEGKTILTAHRKGKR